MSCGKTSACRIFKELGAYVVNSDELVHRLLSPKTTLGQVIIKLLGHDVVNGDNFDRGKIAEKVFNNPVLLESLEQLLHPNVKEEIEKQYNKIKNKGTIPLFVVEIPLLFETGSEKFYDKTIIIVANDIICRKRFATATSYNDDEYEKRMKRQESSYTKAKKVDFIITNNASLDAFKNKILNIFNKLIIL